MALRVKCTCGKSLKIPSELAGKKIACPGCKKAFAIPIEMFRQAEARTSQRVVASKAPSKPARIESPVLADINDPANSPSELDLLGELSGSNSDILNDVQSAPQVHTKPCPSCSQPMATSARICTSCGFDTVKGEAIRSTVLGYATGASKSDLATNDLQRQIFRRFLLGITLSIAGALIGGVAWFVVVYQFDYELGIVAWGVGVLSGIGMALGAGDGSTKAGIIAAVNACLAILGAKLLIFIVIFAKLVTGAGASPQLDREYIIIHNTENALKEKGITDPVQRESAWKGLADVERRKVDRLSDADVTALAARYRNEVKAKIAGSTSAATDDEELADDSAQTENSGDEGGDAGTSASSPPKSVAQVFGAIIAIFLRSLINPFNVLWALLALGSAYRIGSKGMDAFSRD